MWAEGWRDRFRAAADTRFDVLVIGGGITGAGVALEAARAGLRVALIEQNDFASGTSSWSSKLVHGGLRYLASGDWQLTRESVRERQRLMRDVPGLVEPLDFMLPVYRGDKPGRWPMRAALALYDVMAGKVYSRYLATPELMWHMPYLRDQALRGGFVYRDAQTDDVRLTLRVLAEAVDHGAYAANYIRAESLIIEDGQVAGARVVDAVTEQRFALNATCVVNATGPWTDRLRAEVGARTQLRPLRGSHFVFPFHVLPIARAITLFHPQDGRPLFAIPWQGATVFGTTDLDHDAPMDETPRMSPAESDYLMAAAQHFFPSLDLHAGAAVSSYAGVRPVVQGEPGMSASEESRESAIDVEQGLVTVTGGKLTTFRVTARQVLARVGDRLGRPIVTNTDAPIFNSRTPGGIPIAEARRVHRYGPTYVQRFAPPAADDEQRLDRTDYCMRELRFALACEAVEHLDDLMLRRTRVGLLLADGGADVLDRIEPLFRELLNWDSHRWQQEVQRYMNHWRAVHAPERTPDA